MKTIQCKRARVVLFWAKILIDRVRHATHYTQVMWAAGSSRLHMTRRVRVITYKKREARRSAQFSKWSEINYWFLKRDMQRKARTWCRQQQVVAWLWILDHILPHWSNEKRVFQHVYVSNINCETGRHHHIEPDVAFWFICYQPPAYFTCFGYCITEARALDIIPDIKKVDAEHVSGDCEVK